MFIDPAETALIVVDLQERLAPAMSEFEACANRAELLLAGAAGALVVSSEALLFMMLRDAKNPAFKAVSKLVR